MTYFSLMLINIFAYIHATGVKLQYCILEQLTQRSRVRFPALVWNGVHSALVRVNEELPERKIVTLV
jgi:hypothetical protein